MPLTLPGPLTATRGLANHLHDNLVPLDGSYKLPGETPVAPGPAKLAVDA